MTLLSSEGSRKASEELFYYEKKIVKVIARGQKNWRVQFEDGSIELVPAAGVTDKPRKDPYADDYDDDAEYAQMIKERQQEALGGIEIPQHPEGQIPKEYLKPQRRDGEESWKEYTLKQAQQRLLSKGFRPTDRISDNGFGSTLYVWQNPHTTQRANLSHKHLDKKGNKQDVAKIAYHLVTKPKRRTPEQKRRDNYVQYD
jgi:hypothetical protein